MPPPPDEESAWPRRLNRGLVVAAGTIVLLALLGVVLSQAGDLRGNNPLHLQLEYFAVFAAVSIFFLSSAKYSISRQRVYLPISLGFLAAAIFDLLHPLVPHGAIPASTAGGFEILLQDLNGYLWWMGRLSFGVGFLAAGLAFRHRILDETPNRLLVRGLLWTFAEIILLVALVVLLPLPTYYGSQGVSPALELLPLLLYTAAAYVILRTSPTMEPGLRIGGVASLALAAIAQLCAAASGDAGDALFFVAHAFKITSYLVVLFGLYLEHVSLYAEERHLRQNVEEAEREALRRRAELFAVIENTTDGIAILDRDARLLHLNHAAQRLLRCTDPAAWTGTVLHEHLSGQARTVIEGAEDMTLQRGRDARDLEITLRGDNRANHYLSVGFVALRDAAGAVQGAVADFHDVTSLRVAERRYRELTEGAPDGILEMSEDGTIAFFNRAAERIFGHAKDEVLGRDVTMLVPPRFWDALRLTRDRFLAGGDRETPGRPLELMAHHKDGREIAIELTLSATVFENVRRITAIVRDVHQLQRTRREKAGLVAVAEAVNLSTDARTLTENAAKGLREVLDYDAVAIYLKEPGRLALTLTGLGTPEAAADPARAVSLKLQPPDAALPVRAFLDRQPVTGTGKRAILATSPDGAPLPLRDDSQLVCVPVFVGDEVAAVLAGISSSHRHTVDEEVPLLQTIALHLALGMGQKLLFHELQETAKSLSVTNRELDAFIYTASHDLAEPLRSMSNFSQFLIEDYSKDLAPLAQDYLRRIHEGALRMRALLDALLQVSRIRHRPLPFERVDTAKILSEVQESLDAMIRERHGEVVVREPMPRIYAQPTRIMEVFNNLVSNGLKFNESKVPRVEIEGRTKDGVVEFSVRDNGIGIPAKYQDRVFGLFTRLHPRNQYPGTGAGLAIVRTIIEQHGGEVRIESKEGEGTNVIFTLPREPS